MEGKEERIKKEEKRLLKYYEDLDSRKKEIAQGLIQRAAHLRITLEDMAADLDENGYVEKFQQSPHVPPYERKRPNADLFTAMSGLYQKAIKQLTDLLPKETAQNKADDMSAFDEFITGRDD